MRRNGPIGVNFVTDPYEATVYLDGKLQSGPNGVAYRTPCTIQGLTPRPHHVRFRWDEDSGVFELPGRDGTVDAGMIDFSENREVTLRVKAD
jgi:hypothetical protein